MHTHVNDHDDAASIRRLFDELVFVSRPLAPAQVGFLAADYLWRVLDNQRAVVRETAHQSSDPAARQALQALDTALLTARLRRRTAASVLLAWAQAAVRAHPDDRVRQRYAQLLVPPPPHDEAAIEAALALAVWMERR